MAVHPAEPAARPAQGRRRSTGAVTVAVEAAPELHGREDRPDPNGSGWLRGPADSCRPTGSAPGRTPPRPRPPSSPCRRKTVASAPTYVRVTGTGTDAAAAGHLVIDVQPYGRATVVIDQTGSATYADNVEIHVADGGDLTVVALADWADDTVQVAHHAATLGKDAHLRALRGDPRRQPGPALADRQVRRPRRRRRAVRHHVRRRRAAPGGTGCSSTTTRRTAAAASATRARCPARARARCGSATCSSGRRRPAPTPTSTTGTWCSPTGRTPTRCRTWRSSPARSSAPGTPRPAAASTTSTRSTCRPAASRSRRRAAW